MSRSYRHSPVFAETGADSEKKDKHLAHKRQRAHFRTAINSAQSLDEFAFEERPVAHSERRYFAKCSRSWWPLRVRSAMRRLVVLAKPDWMRSERLARRQMAK